mmetsp:Transcript_87302/g.167337  ORF Transcript_87302/g.167337 Transcript_87302/m.167337 type:complete len:95 (-) Transcript_87302:14-298(-)
MEFAEANEMVRPTISSRLCCTCPAFNMACSATPAPLRKNTVGESWSVGYWWQLESRAAWRLGSWAAQKARQRESVQQTLQPPRGLAARHDQDRI